jgi:hypothetical protein
MSTVMPRLKSGLVSMALACASTSIWACTLSPDYRKPSNYELVRDTPVIVLARAESVQHTEPPGDAAKYGFRNYRVVMSQVEPIKGQLSTPRFSLEAWYAFRGAGDETDFSTVRPGASEGACNAFDFRVGALYVLFFQRGEGGRLVLDGPPYSRISEEVAGVESPWIAAVRHYARIAALRNDAAEEQALKALLPMPREASASLPAALEQDVQRHFQNANSAKPLKSLLALLAQARRAEALARTGPVAGNHPPVEEVLMALAQKGDPAARPEFEALLRGNAWAQHADPLIKYIFETRDLRLMRMMMQRVDDWRRLGVDEYAPNRHFFLWMVLLLGSAEDRPAVMRLMRSAEGSERTSLQRWLRKSDASHQEMELPRR